MSYLLTVSLLWALSFGLMPRVSPLGAPFVAAVRSLLALALFLPMVRIKGLARRDGLALAGIGALQLGLMYVLYTASFRWLRPSEVALFTNFTPILVALAEDLLEWRLDGRVLGVATLAVLGTGLALGARVRRLDYFVPPAGAGAEMLEGSVDEVAGKLVDLLKAKGGIK